MNVRAVIFDVYGTLLEVRPPLAEPETGWTRLHQEFFHRAPRMSRAEFSVASGKVVAREHELSRSRGVANPEIVWPSVVAEVLPEWRSLTAAAQVEFISRQIQLSHTTSLHSEAAVLLPQLRVAGCLLGIASNAQAYTVRELDRALAESGLDRSRLFQPNLCFWSFEHGFSKPNAHVFQILTARLEAHGVQVGETLMVGDRLDHDMEPARRHGWQTWWLTQEAGEPAAGPWLTLARVLHDSVG
jgi:FMN phosphatase YigB (HAD superfamily)